MYIKIIALFLIIAGVFSFTGSAPKTQLAFNSSATTAPIWVFGDSIAAGTWLPSGQGWVSQLDGMLGGGQITNYGMGGQAVAYSDPTLPRMDEYVKSMVNAAGANKPRLILFAGGINDMIRSADVSPTRTAVYNLVVWLNARGIRTLVHTITGYASDAPNASILNSRRLVYNQWVRDMYSPSRNTLDVGDVLIGETFTDPRYNYDDLHPNVDGAEQLARAVYNQLRVKKLI